MYYENQAVGMPVMRRVQWQPHHPLNLHLMQDRRSQQCRRNSNRSPWKSQTDWNGTLTIRIGEARALAVIPAPKVLGTCNSEIEANTLAWSGRPAMDNCLPYDKLETAKKFNSFGTHRSLSSIVSLSANELMSCDSLKLLGLPQTNRRAVASCLI